jgi:hypothetical protein
MQDCALGTISNAVTLRRDSVKTFGYTPAAPPAPLRRPARARHGRCAVTAMAWPEPEETKEAAGNTGSHGSAASRPARARMLARVSPFRGSAPSIAARMLAPIGPAPSARAGPIAPMAFEGSSGGTRIGYSDR